MFTLLHISDLHRSENEPYTNSELLSALSVDRGKLQVDAPPISLPNALVVSGDLIRGLPIDVTDRSHGLDGQYAEAIDLIDKLTVRFFDGDRSRVIIVPGNHDVDWHLARSAMHERDTSSKDFRGKVYDKVAPLGSKYRWDWRELKLWEIADDRLYRDRFSYFNNFVNAFYERARLKFSYQAQREWNLFELCDGQIVVAAFNSCVANDCFSQIGQISQSAIAECHLAIEENTNPNALRIAVWHHSIEGPPTASDYMDSATVRLLIDKGFVVGLHGHHHKSEASPHTLFASGKFEMAVFSAGSLCAGSKALPQGYNPQYNLLELDLERRSATVHVREMIERGIFAQGRLNVLNRASFLRVDLGPQSPTRIQSTANSGGIAVRIADEIEELRIAGKYREAIEKLDEVGEALGQHANVLRLRLLAESKDWKGLIAFLQFPGSLKELLLLVRAYIEQRDPDAATAMLERAESEHDVPKAAVTEFRARIQALRTMNS